MKKIKKILILILIFLAGFGAGNAVKYYLDAWWAKRSVNDWIGVLQSSVTNDTYGGKTPEETFDLYLAALKKGDLELASKYFVMEKQKQRLEQLKKEDLTSYTKEIESVNKDSWTEKSIDDNVDIKYMATRYSDKEIQTIDSSGKIITTTLNSGKYTSTMNMIKRNNIWKLYLL